ncbi:MAG: hypothetical protein H8E78_05670 [Proteobacteria bacterium]|nr:hypothetical protein [Pseudomonadota bacterium]
MAKRDPDGQISVEQRDNILLMGIDRPEKRNGLTPRMVSQLRDAYTRLDEEDDLHVGILFGHGEHFTAGLDPPQGGGAREEKGGSGRGGPRKGGPARPPGRRGPATHPPAPRRHTHPPRGR